MPVLSWPQDQASWQAHIKGGGIFAYPSEAVFGLGGDPAQDKAVRAILALKAGRDVGQGMLLVAGDAAQAQSFVRGVDEQAWQAMYAAQEARATTFLLPAGERVSPLVVVDGKVALRLSRHPLIVQMTAVLGHPLLSTSANPHGEPPARSVAQTQAYFPELWVMDGETGGAQMPSRIIDWQSRRVIRA